MSNAGIPTESSKQAVQNASRDETSSVRIVGMAASASDPHALERFFANAPVRIGLAYVVAQHLATVRPHLLTHLIAQHTQMPVLAATNGTVVQPDHVYVIQPGTVLSVVHRALQVEPITKRECNPIDVFLQSLAEEQRENAIGVLLSGMGTDGTAGLGAIKRHGGRTLAEAPHTARYAEMLQSAINAGVVDAVFAAENIPAALIAHVLGGQRDDTSHAAARVMTQVASDNEIRAVLRHICDVLFKVSGRDFSQYKRGTLIRRIRHRLQRLRVASLDEYVYLLERDPQEPELLSKALLVRVTQFFRDPAVFDYLNGFTLSRILGSTAAQDGVRIWVPGCASGEEAYSLGILLRERLAAMGATTAVQIFATDIDPNAIAEARLGRYPESIANDVSPERLARFFTRDKSSYRVTSDVREMCVFSEHSLIRDPPFLGLDLISCRNVLIYLESSLQRKLIPVFHYALRRRGFLFLGPSEGLAGHVNLFHTVEKRFRVFQRAETVSRPLIEWPATPHMHPRTTKRTQRESLMPPPQEQTVNAVFEKLLLQEYVPPSAVVNERGDTVCIAGWTGSYFQPPAGLLSTNLLEIAHTRLRIELRTALHAAARIGTKVVRDNIAIDVDGEARRLRLIVRPMPRFEHQGLFAVVLQEQRDALDLAEHQTPIATPESAIEQLESELRATRSHLRASIEELASANEELKSSNEELLSTNEEMQSSNEELQSSHEEQKSVNEDLATVNVELNRRIEELARANADLQSLFRSTDVATLFLDLEQRITKFTPAARFLFRLIDADSGRPFADLAPRFHDFNLLHGVKDVLTTLQAMERQVETADRKAWYLIRILPYRTIEGHVLGTVVTLIDITQSKQLDLERERLLVELRKSEEQLRADLDVTTRLLKASSLFLLGGNLSLVLDDILDAAVTISSADFGCIQLVDHASGDLRIMAHRGLPRVWLDQCNELAHSQGIRNSALEVGKRLVIEDVETHPPLIGTRALEAHLRAGVRAIQETPLSLRSGKPIGVLSTFHKVRGKPSEHALRLLDLIARQTADILERAQIE